MSTPTHAAVRDAADAIVQAFAATDTARYFAGFSPDATFIFHSEPGRINSRQEYETLWQGWVESGWKVTECRTSAPLIQVFPGGAVLSHTVHTSIDTPEGSDSYTERETIVFTMGQTGALVAMHEHLSTVPEGAEVAA